MHLAQFSQNGAHMLDNLLGGAIDYLHAGNRLMPLLLHIIIQSKDTLYNNYI